ncbi:MAG: DUF2812 domain-containing protein [Erysipelotrichaceae bacterium]|nr:DUF2812 domain-containing protein [Erysipelotrichaceae bacterium]
MKETKTIRKVFLVYDFEKEEAWLNEMAENGWALCGVGICSYTFEACEPGEYTVRMEMRGHDDAYQAFLEEIGAEYIGRIIQWVYYRRKSSLGAFDLFSDIDSRISHLQKIGRILTAVGVINLIFGTMNLLVGLTSAVGNTSVGFLNLLAATLLMYCLGRIHGKIEALQKERLLHE